MGKGPKQTFFQRRHAGGQQTHEKMHITNHQVMISDHQSSLKIKTTMRYHLIPIRMTINKTTNNRCWRGCGKKGTLMHCWWDCKPVSHYGKEYDVPQKNKNWASLVAQWLRILLPMQGTRVRALVWEDPTFRGATKPMHHNY